MTIGLQQRLSKLLTNSRFWIFASGIVLSINIAGLIQLFIPAGILQTIRIEQSYGFMSILLLYLALLASPLTKVYPKLSFKAGYLHARRAIGVLAFYYAILHAYLSFFQQLDGFSGVKYYNNKYSWSILLGMCALGVLCVMAVTSIDWAVETLGFKRWKLLHRLVYLSGIAILIHVVLIGTHYASLGLLSTLTGVALAVLLWLEAIRLYRAKFVDEVSTQKGHREKY